MDALCGDASELRDSLLVNRSIRFFKNFRLSCCAGFFAWNICINAS
jgi:hypothetical protein